MGSMIASTLKLGIAVLSGGNATVQQVQYCIAVCPSNHKTVFCWVPKNRFAYSQVSDIKAVTTNFNIMKQKIKDKEEN